MLSKYRVLTLNAIAPKGLALLPPEKYEVGTTVENPDAILLRSADLHAFAFGSRLKVVARAGAGVNNIPVETLSRRGVGVFNTPGANANAVKELTLAGLLLAARHICEAHRFVEQLEAPQETFAETVEAAKKQFRGVEIAGKTLGVIGLGAIGVRVANAAVALGMRVVGFDPAISVRAAWQLNSHVVQALSLEELLQQADFVSVHVPLLSATRHLINSERLALMKPQASLLNFARGEIVDTQAVRMALQQERLAAYVHDFPSPDLQGVRGCISLPHLGASTQESEENCAVMAVEEIRTFLEQGTVRNSVNLPDVELGPVPAGMQRLAIVNDNDAGMIAAITQVLGAANLNIEDMVNKSRDELAYTLIDVTGALESAHLQQLQALQGVRSVRVCH